MENMTREQEVTRYYNKIFTGAILTPCLPKGDVSKKKITKELIHPIGLPKILNKFLLFDGLIGSTLCADTTVRSRRYKASIDFSESTIEDICLQLWIQKDILFIIAFGLTLMKINCTNGAYFSINSHIPFYVDASQKEKRISEWARSIKKQWDFSSSQTVLSEGQLEYRYKLPTTRPVLILEKQEQEALNFPLQVTPVSSFGKYSLAFYCSATYSTRWINDFATDFQKIIHQFIHANYIGDLNI